jgi:hypothetical protein
MTETLVVRELAVRELDPKLGNLGGADGTRLGQQPQPTSDFEIAKISAWCRKHGYTCHVSLRGQLELRKKNSAMALLFARRRRG